MSMTVSTKAAICDKCGSQFESQVITVMRVTVAATVCDSCSDSAWADAKSKIKEPESKTREERFIAKAAAAGFKRYLNFDLNGFPSKESQAAFIRANDRARFDNRGAIIAGPTGKGKTFAAIEIARQRYIENKSAMLIDSIAFGMEVANADGARREKQLADAISVDWLVFDDLAKMVISPRVAEALFYIAKMREDSDRPTIWTTNATEDQIIERFPVEIADPFLERLHRHCDNYLFV